MSLSEAKLLQVAKQQYFYKMKLNFSLLFVLVILQVLTLAGGQGGLGAISDMNGKRIYVYDYSSNLTIGVTLVWALLAGLICTSRTAKDLDFTYISNRFSSNISNIWFLLTAAVIGGVTSSLSGMLTRVILFLTMGRQYISEEYFFVPLQDLLTGILATTLYMILTISIGYFSGTLIQRHKAFGVLLPLIAVITFRLGGVRIIQAFTEEASLVLFTLKVLAASAILFYMSTQLSNRMEVRK